MAPREFQESPVTIEVERSEDDGGLLTMIAEEAWLDNVDGHDEMFYAVGGEARSIGVGQRKLDVPGRWEFLTPVEETPVTVRAVEEDDVVASRQFNSLMPLPRDVITASLRGFNTMQDLEAMVADDGYVRTLLLATDLGLYVRYSGMWHKLTDSALLDGLTGVEVENQAVDVYDPFDQAGQLVSLSSLPTKNPGDAVPPPTDTATATPPPVIAASATTDFVVINSARDVPRAVQAAEGAPQYRWYVERRLKALEVDYPLPWSEGG